MRVRRKLAAYKIRKEEHCKGPMTTQDRRGRGKKSFYWMTELGTLKIKFSMWPTLNCGLRCFN